MSSFYTNDGVRSPSYFSTISLPFCLENRIEKINMSRGRAIISLMASASLVALGVLVNNFFLSSPLIETIPNVALRRNLKQYTNDNFATYTFQYKHPFTPDDTIGNTSFRIFDKTAHVNRKFNIPTDKMPTGTKDTLDFMIAGFPKCGTSYLVNYLDSDPDISMFPKENCHFFRGKYGDLSPVILSNKLAAARMKYPDGKKIAFKCPAAVTDEGFDHVFSTFYPETDIIIGVRHPVQFFRSYYNYGLRKRRPNGPVSFANELFGSKCHLNSGTCTDAAKFALPLSKMGKTELGEHEIELLSSMVYIDDPDYQKKQEAVTEYLRTLERPKMGRVFFYALEQVADEDTVRQRKFVEDLSNFVGLDHVMEKELVVKESHEIHTEGGGAGNRNLHQYYVDFDGSRWDYDGQSELVKNEARARHDKMQIDICEPTYEELRKLLIEDGEKTATWIRDYFLDGDGVVVSQREHLEKILDTFSVDPCAAEQD